jgi:hypothetical protein
VYLTTCYKLILASGPDYEVDDGYGHKRTCADLRRAFNVYGTPEAFGLATPIPLSDILERVSLDAALWCLRCTHPEQVSVARRIARSLAMDAALEGEELWPEHNLYREAWDTASAYMEGDATLEDLKPIRLQVYETILLYETILPRGSLANYGLATYLMLSEKPERYTPNVVEAGIKAATPDGSTKGASDVRAIRFRSHVTAELRDMLKPSEEADHGIGPGEITEPTNRGRPVTNRRKLIVRYNGKAGGGATQEQNDRLRQKLINWGI